MMTESWWPLSMWSCLLVVFFCPTSVLLSWHWPPPAGPPGRSFLPPNNPRPMWHYPPVYPPPPLMMPHPNLKGIEHNRQMQNHYQFHPNQFRTFQNPNGGNTAEVFNSKLINHEQLIDKYGPLVTNVSASVKISTRRSDGSSIPPGLMTYSAPPSYNRINDPPSSIWLSSQSMSPHIKTKKPNQNLTMSQSIPGFVKLSPSASVQFPVPEANWASAVSFKVSLRPDAWTKATRPSVTEEMKRFLPELKYYEKGLKPIDMSKVKTSVEKYVLVTKKKEKDSERNVDYSGEIRLPSTDDVSKNNQIVENRPVSEEGNGFPMPRDQKETKDQKSEVFVQSWANEAKNILKDNTLDIEMDVKEPEKSIKDIVAKIFATTIPTPEDIEDDDSEEIKKLSEMFDIVYVRNKNNSDVLLHLNQSKNDNVLHLIKDAKKIDDTKEEKMSSLDSVILRMAGLPRDFNRNQNSTDTAIPVQSEIQIKNLNKSSRTNKASSSLVRNATSFQETRKDKKSSEQMWVDKNRCQGMWCFHDMTTPVTPKDRPVFSTSSVSSTHYKNLVTVTTTSPHPVTADWNSSTTGKLIDPLLEYLGLAWPQILTSSEVSPIQTTSEDSFGLVWDKHVGLEAHAVNPLVTQPSLTKKIQEEGENELFPKKNSVSVNNNDPKTNSTQDSGFRISRHHKQLTSHESEPTKIKLSPQQLELMFSAMGHGIKQVMAIVSPLVNIKNPDMFDDS